MKKLILATAATFLFASLGMAQYVPNNCPRYGTPQQGQGPKDGTGYGAKNGKKSGPQNGQRQGQGPRAQRGGRR